MATRMQRLTYTARVALALGMLGLAGCLGQNVDDKIPKAVIEVQVGGMLVDATKPIPFSGMPVVVMLDGSKSSDEDGQVVGYTWFRTDFPAASRVAYAHDGGVPPADSGLPAFTGDPPPSPQVTLTLNAGKYRYSLWVKDNKGEISAPTSVSLQIGAPPAKFVAMPDMTCAMQSMNPKKDCKDCTCTPNAMGGCLDEFNMCFNNQDAAFSAACSAFATCSVTKPCTGSTCVTANPCAAEMTAAATYMGGSLAMCTPDMAAMNPCAAAAALSACTNKTSMCASACK